MTLELLKGRWNIQEMENWDEEYFNMEEQAFILIEENKNGKFLFGLVNGYFHGDIYSINDIKRFEFTWEGNDEMDEASGFGWITLESKTKIKGEIRFHQGDSSEFIAIKG